MKKIVSLVLSIFILGSIAINVSAYRIGDVIGNTVYTDIVAKINGYDIESYNINGYTAICVEDLRAFGYDVIWDQASRSLKITKLANGTITSSFKHQAPASYLLGKKRYNVLFTDIKTYINGVEVTSYNINGRTIMYFNDLAAFGTVNYDNNKREISLSTGDFVSAGGYTQGATSQYYPGTIVPTFESITGIKMGLLESNWYKQTYEIVNTKTDLLGNVRPIYTDKTAAELLRASSDYCNYLINNCRFRETIDRTIDSSNGASTVTWYLMKDGTTVEVECWTDFLNYGGKTAVVLRIKY